MEASLKKKVVRKTLNSFRKFGPPHVKEDAVVALIKETAQRFGEKETEKLLSHKGVQLSLVEEPATLAFIIHSGMFQKLLASIKSASAQFSAMGEAHWKCLSNENVLFATFVGFLSMLPQEVWFETLRAATSPEAVVEAYCKAYRQASADSPSNPLKVLLELKNLNTYLEKGMGTGNGQSKR